MEVIHSCTFLFWCVWNKIAIFLQNNLAILSVKEIQYKEIYEGIC